MSASETLINVDTPANKKRNLSNHKFLLSVNNEIIFVLFLALMPKLLAFEFLSFKADLNAPCQRLRRRENIVNFRSCGLMKVEEKKNSTLSLKRWKIFPLLFSCFSFRGRQSRPSQDIVVFLVGNLFIAKHFYLVLGPLENYHKLFFLLVISMAIICHKNCLRWNIKSCGYLSLKTKHPWRRQKYYTIRVWTFRVIYRYFGVNGLADLKTRIITNISRTKRVFLPL